MRNVSPTGIFQIFFLPRDPSNKPEFNSSFPCISQLPTFNIDLFNVINTRFLRRHHNSKKSPNIYISVIGKKKYLPVYLCLCKPPTTARVYIYIYIYIESDLRKTSGQKKLSTNHHHHQSQKSIHNPFLRTSKNSFFFYTAVSWGLAWSIEQALTKLAMGFFDGGGGEERRSGITSSRWMDAWLLIEKAGGRDYLDGIWQKGGGGQEGWPCGTF